MLKIPFLFLVISFSTMAQQELTWKLFHPVKKTWIEAGTHGSVQEKLMETGELPDPFYGENETLFSWVEEHQWVFTSKWIVSNELFSNSFVGLEFPVIDTYASIYLNDSLLGFAQNAFRPYFFDVKKYLKQGENNIKVVFYPPVLYHKEKYEKARYKLPAPNDVHPIAIAPYSRKPQYQFGWDWSLRMTTIGFLKPVKVVTYNHVRFSGRNTIIRNVSPEKADISFQLHVNTAYQAGKIRWVSELFGEKICDISENIERDEWIEQPRLWWPRGQGESYIYNDVWKIYSTQGELLDSFPVKFGIRTSELVQESDQWGTSYVIKVNDRPIFCKGADYIPQDIFPSRVQSADLYKMVENMAKSNFNMVRIWGGGYYPDEAFYTACDSLGIMVWQDFMFACAMYPGDPDFLQEVKEELVFQVPRIASHPCLVVFNGNNEVDVAWKNWGFQLKYKLFGADAREIEAAYTRLFKKWIPDIVANYSAAPYIHTSPLSNWGKDEYYNHGTQHYWGVWHGKDPLSDFAKKIGRFNAEYGFQSFPEFSTLAAFSKESDWDLQSSVMKHHQKSYVGNGMIEKHAKVEFGVSKSFREFVYFSQLTQARAVSMAVTGHRLDAPRCMGTLYWQLNDCWPAPSWSSIDYYGNWKALQYAIQKDYEDVAVLRSIDDKSRSKYHLVSDQIDTFNCEGIYTIFDLSGKKIECNTLSIDVKGNSTTTICVEPLNKKKEQFNHVIRFDWKTANGIAKSRTFSAISSPYKKAEKADVTLRFIGKDSTGTDGVIEIETRRFVRNFWVFSSKIGVEFEENFLDLLPGKHQIRVKSVQPIRQEDFDFMWL